MKKFLIICSGFLLLSQLAAAPLKIASYRFIPAVMSADHADSSYTRLTNGDTSGKSRVIWNLKTQKDKRVVITFVRFAKTSQANSEPIMALPIPIQTAAKPYCEPNFPA